MSKFFQDIAFLGLLKIADEIRHKKVSPRRILEDFGYVIL